MDNREFAERIIRTADEYFFTAEAEWEAAGEIEPVDDDTLFEFRRLVRNALRFHIRAMLVIDMVETDDDQSFEDLLEIVSEREVLLEELVEQNDALATLDEESSAEYSRLFSVSEAIRSFLLQTSAARAAALPYRILGSEGGIMSAGVKNGANGTSEDTGSDTDESTESTETNQ